MNYTIITDISQAGEFLKELNNAEEVALDTETSGLDPLVCKLYSIQLYLNNKAYLFDCLHFKNLDWLVSLLENKKIIGFNLKFDIRVLEHLTGIVFRNIFDISVVEQQLNLGIGNAYPSLADVVLKYCGVFLDKEIRKSFYESGELIELTQQQIVYAIEDVIYLFDIKNKQEKLLAESKQERVINEVEMPLISVLARMENNGITIDPEQWKKLSKEASDKVIQFQTEWWDMAIERIKTIQAVNLLELVDKLKITTGTKSKRDRAALEQITDQNFYWDFIRKNFNIGSWNQILALMDSLGVRDEDGEKLKSTNEKVVKASGVQDQLLDKLFELREQAKFVSTYGDNFLENIHPTDGKVHTTFNQLGARTGRLSSDTPNLQNIPIRIDSRYRDCFIAEPGYKFLNFDFNQQEYRLAGAITHEPVIIQAYIDGFDMHSKTANLVYGCPIDAVPKKTRDKAKNINFAILYGSSAYGLAYNFQIKIAEAEEILRKFYEGYPNFTRFKQNYENIVLKRLFTVTLTGRRRYFEKKTIFESSREYNKYITNIRREGFNTLIQGTAADITKLAMSKIDSENPFGPQNLIPLLQVHDELVIKVKEEFAKEAFNFVEHCLLTIEQQFLGEIPAKVEGKISDKWEH